MHEERWRVKGICGGVEGCMRRGGELRGYVEGWRDA